MNKIYTYFKACEKAELGYLLRSEYQLGGGYYFIFFKNGEVRSKWSFNKDDDLEKSSPASKVNTAFIICDRVHLNFNDAAICCLESEEDFVSEDSKTTLKEINGFLEVISKEHTKINMDILNKKYKRSI